MGEKIHKSADFSPFRSYLLLVVFSVITLVVTYLIYIEIQWMFKSQLQARLLTLASTAALNFSPDELDLIDSPDSIHSAAYKNIVFKLQEIRNQNNDIAYAYILKKTDNQNIFQFVADADSLDPSLKVDLNHDGVVNDEDALNWPMDEYDVSEFVQLKEEGFSRPTVDEEIVSDQWGRFLSSSSPIRKGFEGAEYLIGFDVDVSNYVRIQNLALIPFVLFICFLLLILSSQTFFLVNMWQSRVNDLKEIDRQKDELLGLVSHQLATPVSGLRWNLEMITDGDLGPLNTKQQEELKTMQGVVGNLADLVSMILDVSRVQLGKMKVDKASIDLKQFFREITDVLAPRAHEKRIQFDVRIPESLGQGFIDKRLTHMTVENLISNAVKYTPENGKVLVEVSLQHGMLHCTVQDTGCGIPEADQGKIFGKLYRASNVAAVDGNGFGLFVAKGAVEAQGGKIWFESEEGKGTKFYLKLPIRKITT